MDLEPFEMYSYRLYGVYETLQDGTTHSAAGEPTDVMSESKWTNCWKHLCCWQSLHSLVVCFTINIIAGVISTLVCSQSIVGMSVWHNLNVQNIWLTFIQYKLCQWSYYNILFWHSGGCIQIKKSTVGHLGISTLAEFVTTGLSIAVCHEIASIQRHITILFLLCIVHCMELSYIL